MIRPFGEGALLVELEIAAAAQALGASLREKPIRGITASVPGLSTVLVELAPPFVDVEAVSRELAERVKGLDAAVVRGRHRSTPVVYGGEYGPDLAGVAELCGLTPDEVIARHAGTELRVLFGGFAPGFAYLGDLPSELHVPRLSTPRTRTPVGSVAVAGSMSGIYPAALPGGWRIIGRTPLTLFDPRRDPPAYLVGGDTVSFEPMPADAWPATPSLPDDW
ncbi:MAG: 5-oxoprolinase subunit PxpB [Candidatus Limnocylindria bacterium]